MIVDYTVPAIRFPSLDEGNPNYPLPHDFHDLVEEGKSQARVNAIRLQETPDDLVMAWHCLRTWYLEPLPPGAWYTDDYHESPPLHYQFVWDLGAFARNVQSFWRGFGKSKVLKEVYMTFLLGRRYFTILHIKSGDDFAEDDLRELMTQFEENELLVRDFGQIKPTRGKGAWSATNKLELTNGSKIWGRSVMSRMLGFRPKFVGCDDAEFDQQMRVAPRLLTENMKKLWKGHIRPMMERGTSVLFLGTLNTRKSFLYHMAKVSEGEDPSVSFFNRVVTPIEVNGVPSWDRYTPEDLELIKDEVGLPEYCRMYLNDPGTEDERMLNLHHKFGYYTVDGTDYLRSPLASDAQMISWRNLGEDKAPQRVVRNFGEAASGMYRIMLADPIKKPSIASDWASLMVIGVERSSDYNDHWWVLDLRCGRVADPIFFRWIWEMGVLWRPKVVAIESIGARHKLAQQVGSDLAEKASMTGWMPRVFPVRYVGDMSNEEKGKGKRISGLTWRFEHNRIKYPKHLMGKHPFTMLREQTDNFTEDLHLLTHDDVIDTLAMGQFVVNPRVTMGDMAGESEGNLMDLLAEGKVYFPGTKVPILAALNMQDLTPKALAGIEKRRNRPARPKKITGRRVMRRGRGW